MKKNSRAKEVQANSAVCLTSSSGNNELCSPHPPYTWTDVRNRTHVEFWIPTNGCNTATAQNWPHPDVFPSLNCLHSTLSSFSSYLFLFLTHFNTLLHFLTAFFVPLLYRLCLSFIFSFSIHPTAGRPTILIHPHTSSVFFWCLIFKPRVFSRCSLQLAEKIWTHLQNTYKSSENARLPFRRIYCLLNAIVAQSKNCPFTVNTKN